MYPYIHTCMYCGNPMYAVYIIVELQLKRTFLSLVYSYNDDYTFYCRDCTKKPEMWMLAFNMNGKMVAEGIDSESDQVIMSAFLQPGRYDVFCLSFTNWLADSKCVLVIC